MSEYTAEELGSVRFMVYSPGHDALIQSGCGCATFRGGRGRRDGDRTTVLCDIHAGQLVEDDRRHPPSRVMKLTEPGNEDDVA